MLSLWLIPAFPLLGAVLNGFLGVRMPRAFVSWIAVGDDARVVCRFAHRSPESDQPAAGGEASP